MSFSTIFFPFVFLPLALLLYNIVPKIGKNFILILSSLVFFSWGTPEYLVLMVLSIFFNYFTGLELGARKAAGKSGRWVLTSAVAVNLLLLGFFKYYGFLIENINTLLNLKLQAPNLPMPIGISFFTFSILSYLFDVYRDKAPAAKNLLHFALFVTFFPKLVSGPIVQYNQMAGQLADHPVTREKFGGGARLFLIGLGKKVLLSNALGTTFYAISAMHPSTASAGTAWLCALSYSLMLYFDFSGYSDMAIGLAGMFGFTFERNFNYPYASASVAEFWRRWHISLGSWFRDYVYIPLGGSREGKGKTIRNLLVVWLLTGIWHGANWTFLAWGLYYGLILILEKFVFRDLVEKMPKFLKHFFTLFLVIVGWVFFFSDSLGTALGWLASMLGLGNGFFDSTTLYYLSGCWPILLASVFGAFPLGANLSSRLYHRRDNLSVVCALVFFALVLMLSIASMMNDTYSSFLYFQF